MKAKEVCPKCGKVANEVRKYKDGNRLFVHQKKRVNGPFPHYLITESCYVSKVNQDA